jgi:hypothetical protein
MPRILPSQVCRYIASIPVIALLTTLSAALAQQKPAPPSRPSQAQLEDRVKDLEARLTAAEQKADKAAMEKEYILRTQNHYEAYYKEVLSTQTHILWTIGITATLLSITLTAVFFIAGRFGFNIFDRRIEQSLKEVSAQLRTEFAERLANETNALQEAHASELKTLEEGLTKRITQQEEDLKTRTDFQNYFAQGLAMVAAGRPSDARVQFHRAMVSYKSGKPRQVISKNSGIQAVRNHFIQFFREDKAKYVEKAKQELADQFYNDLGDELAQAALTLDWLTPLLNERKPAAAAAAE